MNTFKFPLIPSPFYHILMIFFMFIHKNVFLFYIDYNQRKDSESGDEIMKSVKVIVDILFMAVFLLITFFGIGPVIFADGSNQERLITFLVVLLIYALWFVLLMLWRRKSKAMKA